MTNLPEDELREPAVLPACGPASSASEPARDSGQEQFSEFSPGETSPPALAQTASEPPFAPRPPEDAPPVAAPVFEPPLFHSFAAAPVRPPVRIPHLGHLGVLMAIGVVGAASTGVLFLVAGRMQLFGLSLSTQSAATSVPLILSSEAVLYFITFAISFLVFPLFWHEPFFTGLHWRGVAARKRLWPLAATALGCAGLAALDEVLMPGPTNAPIEKMFSAPEAAWLMFAFGTTIAPFFEEMFFRGFLLPALSTAWDWMVERIARTPAPSLDSNGHPQWSFPAMAVASVLTSIPFALLHVEQQGHSLGPFLLLIVISLVLCAVRLKTRSLAASTLVHALYNFIIFSLALAGTGGFRHFDKM